MSRSSSRSSQTLYVGNLPDDIREREVEYLFYKYGPIVDINLKIPPRPPGYAFIEFVDARDAEDAISGRDGYNFDGHILRVELAHDGRGQSSTYDRHNSYSGGGGGRDGISRRSNYRVLVTGLPSSASWQDLKDHMRRAGDVCFSQVFRENGGTTGIVDYTNYDDMKYAIRKLDDSEFRNAFSRAYIMVKEYSRRSLSRSNSRSRSPTCSYSRSRSPIKSSHAKPSTRSVSRSRSVSSGSKDRSLSRLYRSKIGFMRARCPRPFLSVRAFLLRCIVLYLHSFVISCLSLHHEKIIDIKTMNVGEELERETLPLNMGQRVYRISGLRDSGWYEVKVSYPASIPASFSLQVKSDEPALWLNKNRRLLNTEKTIFKSDSNNWNSGDNETYVLVTVEPAGVVAKPRVLERELVLFNIVCDELAFGIPHKAWWVGSAAVLCLILAAIIPYFFPSHLMLKIQHSKPNDPGVSKAS